VNDPVVIVAPDPAWPAIFADERHRLLPLGFSAIEHVGSTAVPGLPAKPVIDIMGRIPALPPDPALLARLAEMGFLSLETGMTDRSFLHRPADTARLAVHLHLMPEIGWSRLRERRFRDFLLAHPETARAYGQLKTVLAGRHRDDRKAYTFAKTDFIQSVMDRIADETGEPREPVWTD
jgi:GrpB-like predicted nucleotidyltransferase (UPF0157 family)